MRISAVIPAFNAESYIETTIGSLLNQSSLLLEVIVVDDGSEDRTCRLVEKIQRSDARVRLLRQRGNKGVSTARNAGVEAAMGEWILFMDADDLASAALVEKEVNRLKHVPGDGPWVLVYTEYKQIDEQENLLTTMRSRQMSPSEIFGYELVRNEIISTSGTLVSKKAFQDVGGFDPDRKYSEDWDLWLRLAQKGGFAYVDEPLVSVRRHSDNASRRMADMHQAEKEILSKYPPAVIREALFQRDLSPERNLADYVALLFRLDRLEEGRRTLQQSLKLQASGDLFFLQGLFAVKSRDYPFAIRTFEEAVRDMPSHGAALNNLAVLYAVEGRPDRAKKLLDKALVLFPGYMDASHNLKLISGGGDLSIERMKITWRELRKTLLKYAE